jgi:hypothetical protein
MLAGTSRRTLTDPTKMKKLLPSAVLALVVSAGMAAQSFASGCCFGLFPKCCGCCGCGAKFCVRQYNAFSPVCSGTVFCDGCCPFGPCGGYGGYGGPCAGGMCGAGGCGMMPFSGLAAPACGPMGCGDGACLGSLPASEPTPGAPMMQGAGAPMMPGATDGNPVVSPGPLPSSPMSQIVNDRPIHSAAYTPASNSPPVSFVPTRTQPQMMAAPSYWGN